LVQSACRAGTDDEAIPAIFAVLWEQEAGAKIARDLPQVRHPTAAHPAAAYTCP
jgi:hypothetical protein